MAIGSLVEGLAKGMQLGSEQARLQKIEERQGNIQAFQTMASIMKMPAATRTLMLKQGAPLIGMDTKSDDFKNMLEFVNKAEEEELQGFSSVLSELGLNGVSPKAIPTLMKNPALMVQMAKSQGEKKIAEIFGSLGAEPSREQLEGAQTKLLAIGKTEAAGQVGKMAETTGGKFTDVSSLRKEYTKISEDFIAQRDSLDKIRTSAANPSPAGDVGMIFAFMKMLDPISVVREGEQATAQNAAGVPERVRGLYNRVISGEKLTEDQRSDFLRTSENLFKAAKMRHETNRKTFTRIAEARGFDPKEVVIDFDESGKDDAVLKEARDAIAKGADPEKVKERLREMGVDPSGL